MSLRADFVLLTLLLIFKLSRAQALDCISNYRAPNVYTGSITYENSYVVMKWNWQSRPTSPYLDIRTSASCNATYNNTKIIQANYWNTLTGKYQLINANQATINTVCTVCWYYVDQNNRHYQLQPLTFSFVAYCENRTYSINSNSQPFIIPNNSAACFFCYLPGGAMANTWNYNGINVNRSSYLGGYLLVENTSILFPDSMVEGVLTCNDTVTTNSLSAHINLAVSGILSPTQTGTSSGGTIATVGLAINSTSSIQDKMPLTASLTLSNDGSIVTVGLAIISTSSIQDRIPTIISTLISPLPSKDIVISLMPSYGEETQGAINWLSQTSGIPGPYITSIPSKFSVTASSLASNDVVNVAIGVTILMLVIILVAILSISVLIMIWLSKERKEIRNLHKVIKEHPKFPLHLPNSLSVTTQLDTLEWEHHVVPTEPIKTSTLALSPSDEKTSLKNEISRYGMDPGYIKIKDHFDSVNKLAVNLQLNSRDKQLEDYILTLYASNSNICTHVAHSHDSEEGEVPLNHSHHQIEAKTLKCHFDSVQIHLNQKTEEHSVEMTDDLHVQYLTNTTELIELSLEEKHMDSNQNGQIHFRGTEGYIGFHD